MTSLTRCGRINMYELDGNGCPVVIQVITEEDDGSERIQAVYWITYR